MKRMLGLLWVAAGMAAAAAPPLVHTDVFRAGEAGYHSYRIPTLVTAPDGALIAFAEGRKTGLGDAGYGEIDLVYKRSTDGGATWSAMVVLDDPGEKWAASNPTPVTDRERRRVWLVYNRWEPGMGTAKSRAGTSNCQTWVRWSGDNGRTWSAAREITRSVRNFETEGAMFVGPGGAIQTRSGRFVIPATSKFDADYVWATVGDFTGKLDALRAYVLYSDDHGETWQRGALLRALTNESQVAELANGDLMMDARQGDGKHRWVVISADGGKTWSEPRPGAAVGPVATGFRRWDSHRLLWTGPQGQERRHLVIRVSQDEGRTFPLERTLYEGRAAYSDIAILADGQVGVLWERGADKGYQFITFTRCSREFLEAGAAGSGR
jgi:sialidase-1